MLGCVLSVNIDNDVVLSGHPAYEWRGEKLEETDMVSADEPIRRWSLHDVGTARLREMITGQLKPGQKVNEAELCAAFGISRTPLREAIKVLVNEGLLIAKAGKGSVVPNVSNQEMIEIFEAVAGIECTAARLICERASQGAISRLGRMHERLAELFEQGESKLSAYFKLNHSIHLAIVEASGNAVLKSLHAPLMCRLQMARYSALESHERWAESLAEHLAVQKAFRERDALTAQELMYQHVLHTRWTIEKCDAGHSGTDRQIAAS